MGKNETFCDCEIIHKEKVDVAKKGMLNEEYLLNIADFYKKCEDKNFAESFAKKINCASTDPVDLLKCWTAKESLYKQSGKGAFMPSEIEIADGTVLYTEQSGVLFACSGNSRNLAVFRKVENGKAEILSKGEALCR